jgi:predicted O-methyltransferase YrrM
MRTPELIESDDALKRMLEGVDGWLPLPEAYLLRDLAKAVQNDIVEIGCYRGRSTIALCCGAMESGRLVHSVDPHRPATGVYGGKFGPEDRKFYYRNLLASGMAQRAALINLTSAQAGLSWQEPVGLLFLDGDHAYDAIRRDIDIWGAHVVASGIVAFDDASDPAGGPSRVIQELVASGAYCTHAIVGKIHALRKQGSDAVH